MLGQVQRWSVKTEPLGIAVARFVQAVDDLPVADHQRKSTEASFQVGRTARDKIMGSTGSIKGGNPGTRTTRHVSTDTLLCGPPP